jgi:hypothetical protein
MKNGAVETAGSPTKAPPRVVEIPAGVEGRLLSQSAQKRVVLLYSWHLVATLLAAGDAGIIDVHKNRPVHPRHPRRAAAHRSGVVVIVIAPRQNKKAVRMGEPSRKNQISSLLDAEQFHLEEQCAVRTDFRAWGALLAIGQVGRDEQLPFVAHLHQLQRLGPAGDHA